MDRRQFMVAAATTAATLTTKAGSLAAAAESALDALVAKETTDFSGTILVSARGKNLLRRGYGLADRAFATPCSVDTAYRIASITKLLTAVVVMRLVDRQKIDLDAPIATYLPDYNGEGAKTVKIRQLLNHTSGIENSDKALTSFAAVAKAGMPAYQLPHTPRELMDRYASGPLVNPPGTAFDYNNADYLILGQILEATLNAPYEEVVAKEITTPLAMASTRMAKRLEIIPKLASTYYKDEETPLGNDLPAYPENWYAAGGFCSTADDILAFAKALYGDQLMPPSRLEAMLAPGLDEYGFGQWISKLEVDGREHPFAQRPGRIMGANTLLLRLLDDDVTIVILANTNLVDTDRLGFKIARQVLRSMP
jgi:D-alanyl-D-alanine carboxypeptidase